MSDICSDPTIHDSVRPWYFAYYITQIIIHAVYQVSTYLTTARRLVLKKLKEKCEI